MSQFSQAIIKAIHPPCPHQKDLKRVLEDLSWMRNRPRQLTVAVYEWCSVVLENYSSPADGKDLGKDLLLLCLKVGFGHLDPENHWIATKYIQMDHQKMAEIVFESGDDEAIADLLHFWILQDKSTQPPTFPNMRAQYLIGLSNIQFFSPRLQQLTIRSIWSIGFQAFEEVGMERFIGLLNSLDICGEELDRTYLWGTLLLDIIQSSNGIHHLPQPYWEWLVGFTLISPSGTYGHPYSPHTMISLEAAGEWDKLECWMAFVWIVWPPEEGKIAEKDLTHTTLSLFHQQPGAIHKLNQWMEAWSKRWSKEVPKSFQQVCNQHTL